MSTHHALAWLVAVAAGGGSGMDGYEQAVLDQVNALRASVGVTAVRANRALTRAAAEHTADMLDHGFFSHGASNGTPFARRLRRFVRARELGEALIYIENDGKRPDPQVVKTVWEQSPEHRETLVTPQLTRIGISCADGTLNAVPVLMCTADLASWQ